jgi:hypothetical protein
MLAMRRSVDLQLRPITGGQRPGAVQTTGDLSAGKLSSQRLKLQALRGFIAQRPVD